jgi:5-methylcytosine-specific restriction protein A
MKTLRPTLATLGPKPLQPGWKPDEQRGNRHQRGYGSTWDKTRIRIAQRASGLCEPHLREGFVHEGAECDHVKSKAEARAIGWTTEQIEADDNLQWCCREYHLAKTARESRKGGG